MDQKMIFFDIDSTLLDDEKQLPLSTKNALRALQEAGHILAIATGRTPFAFHYLLEELNIDTYVSLNGQYVVYQNEVIYKNPLNTDALHELTGYANKNDHPVIYMDHEDWRSNVGQHSHVTRAIDSLKISKEVTHDPNYYVDHDIYQALLFCTEGNESAYVQRFSQFDFIRWHEFSVDILPFGGSKAVGIKKAIERIGVAPENIYAFGDGLNDIEMLRFVENSVAMGNAQDSVKQAAKHITKDVNEDGVEHGLKMVGLLK